MNRKPQHTLFIISASFCQHYVTLHTAAQDEATALKRFADTTTAEEKALGTPRVSNLTTEP